MPLCECGRGSSFFHTLPPLSYPPAFIRSSRQKGHANAGAECVMEIFSFHPRCSQKTDFLSLAQRPFQIITLKACGTGHLARSGAILRETFSPTDRPTGPPVLGTNRMHFRFVFFAIDRANVLPWV